MKLTSRIKNGVKALNELGVAQVSLYGLYQLGLRTGHYQRQLSNSLAKLDNLDYKHIELQSCLPRLPEAAIMMQVLNDQVEKLYEQADEIVDGKARLFGGLPVQLELSASEPLEEWTKYEFMGGMVTGRDIKLIWEPGRFGWACTLALAYHLSHKEAYAEAFWRYTDQFLASNPPFRGPHWCSAQEVAIRLVSLAFALQAFAQPGLATEEQLKKITRSIAVHAERIPPTLVYARSQNNNHLVTEALGLYTASALLPGHPLAARWHKLGWKWLQSALLTQIEPDGTYAQYSANYHRVMLQAALWALAVHDQRFAAELIPPELEDRLASATRWLWKLIEPGTGRLPNLGHNDGAYLLPLTLSPFSDYRPVVYAAVLRFLQTNFLTDGPWKDMSHWLGMQNAAAAEISVLDHYRQPESQAETINQSPGVLINPLNQSWAAFRTAHFRFRPAHCDQLHVDLWWRDLNLAIDPGTYLYNHPEPWENSLASAMVHNTITVDGKECMLRASRFLYLDWADTNVIQQEFLPAHHYSLTAQHYGYRKLGLVHSRKLSSYGDGHWEVLDQLTGTSSQEHAIRLHWLLPDWEYEVHEALDLDSPGCEVRIHSPYGWISLSIKLSLSDSQRWSAPGVRFQLARAGTLIHGKGEVSPITGWASPTYGVKSPALACILETTLSLPVELQSLWILPNES